MNRGQRRHPDFKRAFAIEQAKQPRALMPVPRDLWPVSLSGGSQEPIEVWRSCHFLVVIYFERGKHLRMSVNRCQLKASGGWADEITWDKLQEIKREIGRGEQWAVECFPADIDLVNVANIRHLWLLDEPPEYGWIST